MQPVYEFWAMYNSNRKFFMENFNVTIKLLALVLLSIVVAASWLLLLPTNKKQVIQFRADVDHFVEAHYAHESRRFSALIRFIGETLINGTSQSSATVLTLSDCAGALPISEFFQNTLSVHWPNYHFLTFDVKLNPELRGENIFSFITSNTEQHFLFLQRIDLLKNPMFLHRLIDPETHIKNSLILFTICSTEDRKTSSDQSNCSDVVLRHLLDSWPEHKEDQIYPIFSRLTFALCV